MSLAGDAIAVDFSNTPSSSQLPSKKQKHVDPHSDVIVISDTEIEHEGSKAPTRRVLSDAQTNLPALGPISTGSLVHQDSFDAYTACILEIIPDVSPLHLRTLLERHSHTNSDNVVETVLHILFEDPTYPRANKRKRADDADDDEPLKTKRKTDYASKNRSFNGGYAYADIAISQLFSDFPFIPKPHIRLTFYANKSLYAPTYLFLEEQALSDPLPYKKTIIRSRVTGKGKQLHDAEFDKERAWLVDYLAQRDKPQVEDAANSGDEECENGVECGCCFSRYAFDKMIQCSEAHLFCRSCCRSYAANQLGQHDPYLRCMDQSGCKEFFPESEIMRFLSQNLLGLYHRLKQQKEVAAAGLEGLEECPFCEYKVVNENPDEKLFRCENLNCGVVSCRACKKVDHLPKSCKEVEEDKRLSVRHAIEEAMSKALMRSCPKCQKAFVKEDGCNKMMCPNCKTLSCYICRQVITGYEHFGHPPPYSTVPNLNKCNLWDPVEQHNDEVIAAAKKAIDEYKALHPDVSDEELNVDLPPPAHHSPAFVVPVIPRIHRHIADLPRYQQPIALPVQRPFPPLHPIPLALGQYGHPPIPAPPPIPLPPLRRRRR